MPDIFTNDNQIARRQSDGIEKVKIGPLTSTSLDKSSHEIGLFSSFIREPRGISIPEQFTDEKILLFIRRSLFTNIPWVISGFALLILPIFFPILTSPFFSLSKYFSVTSIILLSFFYYLIVFGFMFANFVSWFYDIGIVTQERAVDIDFYNISYVSVATARAQDLKDVRYFQRGIFESLFDYGDVSLAVESSNEVLTFDKAPRPAEVVTILSTLIGGHQKNDT